MGLGSQKELLSRIIDSYDSTIVRAYCRARFTIININILHILALCLRGKRKVLDVGCGFGLFGCYFSALYPELLYCGYDINADRVEMANKAAAHLGLKNTKFYAQDADTLTLENQFDAVMMIDLLHHLDDDSKLSLLSKCSEHLVPDGRLIIKDITTYSGSRLMFTWALDVLMTRGFEMWYWDEKKFLSVLHNFFNRVDTFPISDLLPYPHIVYLCENLTSHPESIVNQPY